MALTLLLLAPAMAGFLCLIVRPRWLCEALNILAFGITLALGIQLLLTVAAREPGTITEWNEFLRADALSAWMVLLISLVSFSTSIYAICYFRRDLRDATVNARRFREFYVLTPFFSTGMFLVVLANNLGIMWFALEGTALTSVLLVALYNRKTSLEAAWKYVMLGSLGLALALFGTIFTYAAAIGKNPGETLPSFNWSRLMEMAPNLDHRLIKIAFAFVLVGYGTKTGLAPMHTWLPDAHSEAPSPTSAMLSGVSLKVALYALLRFHILTTHCLETSYSQSLLLGFGLFSMFLAGPFILVQRNLKRLLAYSSLEHIGLICVGIGMGAPLTVFGALLHMGYHALTKPVLFFASGNIHQHFHSLEFRRIGSGLVQTMPVTALLLGLAAVSAAGLPPFGLFVSELTVIAGGFASHQVIVSTLVLLALLMVFCGFLDKIARVLLGSPNAQSAQCGAELPMFSNIAAMSLPLGAVLLFTAWLPLPLRQLMEQAAEIIRGTQ